MKTLLLILVLTTQPELEWKPIPEMSANFPVNVAKIARDGDAVKLLMRVDFPDGAPSSLQQYAPKNVRVSDIRRIEGGLKLNCKSLKVSPDKSKATLCLFDGRQIGSKEPPFKISEGSIFAGYFCEQGDKPTMAPKFREPAPKGKSTISGNP